MTKTSHSTKRPGYQSVKFWDRIAGRYAKKPVPDEAIYEKKLELTRGYLTPESDVFEFGCGTGSTAIVHAPRVRHVRAIDVSEQMLEIARAKADASGVDNISFERATIDEIELPRGRYDVVLGLSILHLVEDKEAVIAKVHAALEPGGVFVSSTACIADHMPWFRFIAPIGAFLGRMPLVKVFGHAELQKNLIDAGFKLDHVWHPGKGRGVFIIAKKR